MNSTAKTATAYRIKDWDTLYENAESRKTKRLSWVAVPNRHDGKGYRRLLKHPDGPGVRPDAPELFAAWILMLQVASRCPTRGILVDSDGPISAEDLSDKTGFPAEMFEKALKVLSEPKIGWIEQVDASGCHPGTSGHAGTELKGTEGKGREEDDAPPPRAPRTRKSRPKSKPTRAPKGKHAQLIDYFVKAWHAKFGNEYAFQGAKDATAAKRVLELCKDDLAKAQAMVDAYLADADTWIAQRGHGLSLLPGQMNRYLAGGHKPQDSANGDEWDEQRDPSEDELANLYPERRAQA